MFFDLKSSVAKKFIVAILCLLAILLMFFTYSAFSQLIFGNKNAKLVGQQEVVIDTLSSSNENLLKSISDRDRSEEKTKEIIQEVSDKQQINKDNSAAEHREVEKKVVEIKKDFNIKISESIDAQKSVKLIKEKEAAVSKVRINSLWTNYCKSEPKDPFCKEIKS